MIKENKSKKRIIFCTFANIESGAYGDAINDRKLYEAIPIKYTKISLFPKYKRNNKLSFKSIIKFLAYYLKEITASDNIFITRGGKLAILPILLKKIFKKKVVIRLGCTPLMFVERKAFSQNLEFKSKVTFLQKLLYFIEPNVEKFALRHADKFIVENNRAKKIIMRFGAKSRKIKIIPYYIQDYFLSGENPKFDISQEYFKLGYVGRFKEYDLLVPIIEAIALLKEKGYRVRIYLIGNGPNRKNIEKLVKEDDLNENIIFLGSKPHREVSIIINEYHCLLLPMLSKLCPSTIAIKVLEGVMKGKIIITTKSGNNVSLFREYTNLIINTTSDKSIAEKIKLVIENYDDFKKIADKLKRYHFNLRSKSIYKQKLNELLTELL